MYNNKKIRKEMRCGACIGAVTATLDYVVSCFKIYHPQLKFEET